MTPNGSIATRNRVSSRMNCKRMENSWPPPRCNPRRPLPACGGGPRARRDGNRLVTDGPFAETREQLGGFFMVEAKDLDEAIGIAGRIPGARWGTVEIRPDRKSTR